ncbi:TetR/AcrR family transcriptional regulator [Cumulibacter soli]|uniref:TetR/AcrR family transcriptional regulator n=1 Tax=Cumulibacter soli TaxID=2546344 RepID=UPI001068C3BC|nr:TetR/AcrR family transcriptional regulator [Cumulibacter soli]
MSPPRAAGRPRDPEIDVAVLEGARAVFMSGGWIGFGFEAVARAAGVGKPAVYRRWRDKPSLIAEALLDAQPPVAVDTGSFRGDISAVVHSQVAWWQTDKGPLMQRILAERLAHDDFARLLDEAYRDRSRALREVTIRGIERGEVRVGVSPSMVSEMAVGAVSMHFNYLPPRRRTTRYRTEHRRFADDLVQAIMNGVAVSTT